MNTNPIQSTLKNKQIAGTPNTRWTISILSFFKVDTDCESVSLIQINVSGKNRTREFRVISTTF